MKLTWFGGTTMRIHIGGAMLVVDADGAPERIDHTELLSGADRAFRLDDDLVQVEPGQFQPRRPAALIEAGDEPQEVRVYRLAAGAVLVEAAGEPPLIIATGEMPRIGRWGRDAVVVVAGGRLEATAASVVEQVGPRLLAVAGSDGAVEAVITALRDRLDGTGLMALEPALALEV